MKELKSDWMTEGIIDFEHKKYVLLAYLQSVGKQFDEQKLYPFLSNLIEHYRSLLTYKENKENFQNACPKRLLRIDLQAFTAEYEALLKDDSQMLVLEEVLQFALKEMQAKLHFGKEIYEEVEAKMAIEPIGLVPLNKDYGYMFLANGNERQTRVYEYELSFFESGLDRYRTMRMRFLKSYQKTINRTYEYIKIDLLKTQKHLPNPATYLVSSGEQYPVLETLLPIAKRSLVRFIAQ